MKKIYLLIIAILLLTGCSVEYNLEFNDTTLKEHLKIGVFDSKEVPDFGYLTPYAISSKDNQELYEFNYINQYLNLKYNYGTHNFEMSEPFNKCYELSNFSYDNEYYYILTSKEFKCLTYLDYTADSVRINFKSNHKVISSNADYINDETHTWIINKNNSKNKPIEIKLEKESKIEIDDNQKDKKQEYLFWIIAIILILSLLLMALSIKKKSHKRDEI